MDNSLNDIQKQALTYLTTYGWSIIPVGRDKKPLLSWKEYQKQRPTEEEVINWFQSSDSNIGVITGKISNIIGVDIDPQYGGSNEFLKEYNTPIVKTGGGGWHYYFFYQEGVPTSSKILPGIDIRSDGGYLVAPPSLHESGKLYEWITSPNDCSFQSYPKDKFPNKETLLEERGLSNIVGGVVEGSRNISAAQLIGKQLHYLPIDIWESEVWPLARAWNEQNQPPLDQKELRTIFDSIAQRESSNANRADKIQDACNDSLIFLSMQDLATAKMPNVEWIWNGYLAKGQATLMSAVWKGGKTTLITHLIAAIRKRKTFLDIPVHPVNILVISEESEILWQGRSWERQLLDDNGIFLSLRVLRSTQKGWEPRLQQIEDFCKEKNIELVIIDPLSDFWPVDDSNSDTEVSKALKGIKKHLLSNNIAVFLIHHIRKSGEGEIKGTQHRGSGALPAAVDILLSFEGVQGHDTQRVIKGKSRFGDIPEGLVVDYKERQYEVLSTQGVARREDLFKDVLAILDKNSMTVRGIADSWKFADKQKPSERTILRILIELEDKGRVQRIAKKGNADVWEKTNKTRIKEQLEAIEKKQQADMVSIMQGSIPVRLG